MTKALLLIALAVVSFGASADNISAQASAEGCLTNCAVIIEHAGRLTTVAKDANGDMIYVERLRIPRSAKLASTTSTADVVSGNNLTMTTQATASDGGRTETRTTTYSGPSGYWVVVTVITYDADGNIVDVNSNTTFFPKNQER